MSGPRYRAELHRGEIYLVTETAPNEWVALARMSRLAAGKLATEIKLLLDDPETVALRDDCIALLDEIRRSNERAA